MIEQLFKYWPVLLFFINGFAVWVSWSVRKGVATQEDLKIHADATSRALKELEGRMTHMEARIEHGPSEDDLLRLHSRLDSLGGDLQRLVGEFSGVRQTLQLLHEFLLEEGKRR